MSTIHTNPPPIDEKTAVAATTTTAEERSLIPSEVVAESPVWVEPLTLEPARIVDERGWAVRVLQFIGNFIVAIVGAISLIVALAILATIPIVNLLSLGYLLEASGRIGRTGRFRAGFIGLRPAAALGVLVFSLWLARWPLVFVAEMWNRARLIDPSSTVTAGWASGWVAMTIGLSVFIAGLALLIGWFWPGVYTQSRDLLWRLIVQRLPYYFWLGLRGFAGALLWLVVPVSILAAASLSRQPAVGFLLSLFGGLLLACVVVYLPFLQTHFAAQNRFRAMFEFGTVRRMFLRAPIAFWIALVSTLLFSLPLYLLMIELLPHEVTWLPAVLFVVFLFPARLLSGWAYSRAVRREQPRFFLFRWLARLGMVPVAVSYAFFVWLSQYLLWYGVGGLYHQHAFLVPVPFLGL